MDENKRKMADGWLDKASNHTFAAKEALRFGRASDSIQASQLGIELSVKSILLLLDVSYSPSHGWGRKELTDIAKQIQERNLLKRLAAQYVIIHLPRLIFLANFWSQFYLEAKYGFEAGYLAPPQGLFDHQDAEHAVRHADECVGAAYRVKSLSDEQLDALATNE